MFELLTTNSITKDYFKTIHERPKSGVYFVRIIGFDDEILEFLKKYRSVAENKGIYINKTIPNPDEIQVNNFFKKIGGSFKCDKPFIINTATRWLDKTDLKKSTIFASAVYEELKRLMLEGANENIIKNSFVKFMCWAKYIFQNLISNIDTDIVPKILYQGDITKYELFMLHILNRSGCDIVYSNFLNQNSYISIDKNSLFSQLIDCKNHFIPEEKSTCTLKESITLNSWLNVPFEEGIFLKNEKRGVLGKSHIYNMFVIYAGIDDKSQYSNRILKLKKDLSKQKNSFIFIENKIQNPSLDEVKNINKITYLNKMEIAEKLSSQINILDNNVITTFVQYAFKIMVEKNTENTLSKVYNSAVRMLCWINRYLLKLFEKFSYEEIPVLMYYGNCNESEAEFLYMLSYIPIDIIFICPKKENLNVFKNINTENKPLIVELANNSEIFPFPQKEVKVNFTTAAYNAERELDTILYENTGLFRNRQFTRSNPVTLKTTYDEIGILWNIEAKYRTGFEANNERVIVPNIFAKISGVKDRNYNEYFNKIETMITSKTIFIRNIPYISSNTVNPFTQYAPSFIKDMQILPDVIKKHKDYRFDYLKEDTQDYILEKLQDIIDLNWIKSDKPNIEFTIISTILNLDKYTLRLISQFNFTGEIPKVIAIDVDESMFSLEDCIYILFLNFVGFDIAIFTPTGYRNIEKYIDLEAFQEHQVGEYLFNINIPPLKCRNTAGNPKRSNERNFIDRLFGRRY